MSTFLRQAQDKLLSASQKGSPRLRLVEAGLSPILIVLILATLVGGYLVYQNQTKTIETKSNQVACSAIEAKICPDGSTTGRVGPKCEFAPYPSQIIDKTTNWKVYDRNDLNLAFTIKVPESVYPYAHGPNLETSGIYIREPYGGVKKG